MYTCVIHRFFDEKRRDYFVMYIHHIVTIALVGELRRVFWSSRIFFCIIILLQQSPLLSLTTRFNPPTPPTLSLAGVSWSWGYLRIGLLVMYVHDVSDIFVDLLKMVNYLKLEGRQGWFGSEIAYVSCVSMWIYYRLYQFPVRVLDSSFTIAWGLFAPDEWDFSWWDFLTRGYHEEMPYYMEMNVCLFLLLIMHTYWFYLLAMVGYRILTESAREASRQEYEGDSDVEDEGEGEDSPKKPLAAKRRPSPTASSESTSSSGSGSSANGTQAVGGKGGDLRQRGNAAKR